MQWNPRVWEPSCLGPPYLLWSRWVVKVSYRGRGTLRFEFLPSLPQKFQHYNDYKAIQWFFCSLIMSKTWLLKSTALRPGPSIAIHSSLPRLVSLTLDRWQCLLKERSAVAVPTGKVSKILRSLRKYQHMHLSMAWRKWVWSGEDFFACCAKDFLPSLPPNHQILYETLVVPEFYILWTESHTLLQVIPSKWPLLRKTVPLRC